MSLALIPLDTTSDPTSIYMTWAQFKNFWGLKNIVVASNKDNTSTTLPNLQAVQDAFDYASGEIHKIMRGGIWKIPLTFLDALDATIVRRWAMIIAFENLYCSRGLREDDPQGNRLAKLVSQVYINMGIAKFGHLVDIEAERDPDVSQSPSAIDNPVTQNKSYFWWRAENEVL